MKGENTMKHTLNESDFVSAWFERANMHRLPSPEAVRVLYGYYIESETDMDDELELDSVLDMCNEWREYPTAHAAMADLCIDSEHDLYHDLLVLDVPNGNILVNVD